MAVKRIRLGGMTAWPVEPGDPVLPAGEAAIDTDTGVIKVGNGTDPFSQLPVVNEAEGGGSGDPVSWDDITDKPSIIAAGPTQAAARSAIGAGTSNLTLGTTSTTAKPGDYQPSWGDVTDKPEVAVVVEPPDTADAAGEPGQIAFDAQYLYVCVSTDTWLRAEIATWPVE